MRAVCTTFTQLINNSLFLTQSPINKEFFTVRHIKDADVASDIYATLIYTLSKERKVGDSQQLDQ